MKQWIWIVFHPRATAKLLDHREKLIYELVTEIHERVWNRPTGLTDMIHTAQEIRYQGFRAGVNAARRKDEQSPQPE